MGPLCWLNWNLILVLVEGGSKATTNNKLIPQMAPGQNQAQPHWWEQDRSFTTTPYLPGQVVKQHRTVIIHYSLLIHNTVLSLISPLTRSVILLVCPRNILTIRLISISTTCISKSSKETASKELCKKNKKKKHVLVDLKRCYCIS